MSDLESPVISAQDIDLSSVPIRALTLSTRKQLSSCLSPWLYIPTLDGHCRDYRGIAQLMGLEASTITSLSRQIDPVITLLEMYERKIETTVSQLLDMIETIERFDTIDDMTPLFLADAKQYLIRKRSSVETPESEENKWSIGSNDVFNYHAYICYADEDQPFAEYLQRYLESPEIGLRVFVRYRDLRAGGWAHQEYESLIAHQCKKVLIIVSPDFLNCPECHFQTALATGLAIELRSRKLIPVIYKECMLPPFLSMLTKIKMVRPTPSIDPNPWTLHNLVKSITDNFTASSNYLPVTNRQQSRPDRPRLLELPSVSSTDSTENSLISLPSVCPSPTAPPLISTQSSICSSIASESSYKSLDSECLPIINSEKNSKKVPNKKWIQSFNSFRQKFKM